MSKIPFEEYEKRMDLALAAIDLKDNKMFNKVVNHLIAEQTKVLTECDPGTLTGTQAHAILRALGMIKNTLGSIAADKVVLEKQGRA